MIEWFAQRGRWTAAVLGVLAIVVGIGAFVLLDQEPGEEVGEYLTVPYLSDEDNEVCRGIWDEIYTPAAEKGRISDKQLSGLRSYLDPSQPYFVRDLAMNVMAELVRIDVDMSDASKEQIVQSFLLLLADDEWRLQRGAVTNVHTIDLLHDRRVYNVVKAMLDDPRVEVANRVRRIDWSEYEKAG